MSEKSGATIGDFYRAQQDLPAIKTSPEELLKFKKLETGILPLDKYLDGGLPRGITLIHGNDEYGKSMLAARIALEQAKKGNTVIYIPGDNTLISDLRSQLSVEEQRNILIPERQTFETLNEILESIPEESGISRLIIIDLVNRLISEKQSQYPGVGDVDRGLALPKFARRLYNLSSENTSILLTSDDRISFDERRKKQNKLKTEPATGQEIIRLSTLTLSVTGHGVRNPFDLEDTYLNPVEKRKVAREIQEHSLRQRYHQPIASVFHIKKEKPKVQKGKILTLFLRNK